MKTLKRRLILLAVTAAFIAFMGGATHSPPSVIDAVTGATRFMVFHRCHAAQFNLVPTSIVVSDVFFNRCDQTSFIRKLAKIIHLGLQDAPPAFHWAVVNASPDTGHTLYHSGIDKFLMEYFVGILKSSVTVEDRMSVRIEPDSFIKCGKYKIIVVALTNLESYDTSVIKVENGTQIQLLDDRANIVFELCHIGEPLLIRLICVEIPFQDILCCDLRR